MMLSHAHYPPVPASTGLTPAKIGGLIILLTSMLLLGLSGLVAFRWIDGNLLHWGVEDAGEARVNHAELLARVRAFELATVKHTYASEAHIDVNKAFAAGPARISLPGWLAGQKLDVKGNVIVTAGVDLAGVRPEDMELTREGKTAMVLIKLPAAQVLSTQIEPNTLDMSTSAGALTRIKTQLGLSEEDLRDRAADELVTVAEATAVRGGLLAEATRETEQRLAAFLQSLPQGGDEKVTYVIVVREPAPAQQELQGQD